MLIGVLVGILVFSGDADDEEDWEKNNDNKIANNNPGNGDPNNKPGVIPNGNNGGNNGQRQKPVVPPNNPPGGIQPPVVVNQQPPVGIQPPKGLANPGGIVRPRDPDDTTIPNTAIEKWTAKVDPPAEPIIFTKNDKLILTSPVRASGDTIFPSANSAFVAIGRNSNPQRDHRIVQDLRTNTKVGEIRNFKLLISKGVLSPDGAHFAAFSRTLKAIVLYDVKAGKRLGTLPVDEKTKNAFRLKILDFAGPNRLVAAGENTPLWVWSVPEGKPERSIPLPSRFVKESIAFSPGGKYFSLFSSERGVGSLSLYDLSTGSVAGKITIPKEFGSWGCSGMSFSPDGSELAGMFKIFLHHRLYCWNISNGKLVAKHTFKKDPKYISYNYKGPAIQWFPDKSRWLLYGNLVVDRKIGKVVWTVPKIPGAVSSAECRLLGDNRVAILGRQGLVVALATLALPLAEIDKGTKIVASGGTQADAALPTLKQADYSGVKIVPIDGVASRWSVAIDPAPKPAGKLLASTLQIKSGIGRVIGLSLSHANAAKAIVASEKSSSIRRPAGAGIAEKTPELRLDRYDVAAGKHQDSFDVTFPSALMASSPSGQFAAVRYKTGQDRIDVFSLEGKTHVAGWRPYKDEKTASYRKITQAVFIDDDHLLTQSARSKLVLWKLPECQAKFVIEKVRKFVVSPSGKYFLVATMNGFRLFESRTGSPVGDVHLQSATPSTAGFHPDGEKLAITFISGNGAQLGIVNLQDGQLESSFPIPTSGQTLQWAGSGHVLVDNRLLIDLKNKAVVWNYLLTGGVHAPSSPDGRHWYLAGGNPLSLNAVQLPDPATLQRLANKDLAPKMLLKSGMSVSLNIQLAGISGHPNLVSELTKSWTDRFKQRGITVAPGQKIVLFARAEKTNSGKSKEFVISKSRFGLPPSRFGGTGNVVARETIQQSTIKCRVVIGLGNQAFNERKNEVTNFSTNGYFSTSFRLKKGETAHQFLTRRQSDSAASFLRSYFPPGVIFAPQSKTGLGTSQLTTGGARPQ